MHGCVYAEHIKLPALLYQATGEQRYLEMAVSAQQKLFAHHMLVDGAPSSSEALFHHHGSRRARDLRPVRPFLDLGLCNGGELGTEPTGTEWNA